MKYFSVAFVSIFSKTVLWNNYVLSYKDKNGKIQFFLMFTLTNLYDNVKTIELLPKICIWSHILFDHVEIYWTIFAIQIQTYYTNKSLSSSSPSTNKLFWTVISQRELSYHDTYIPKTFNNCPTHFHSHKMCTNLSDLCFEPRLPTISFI